MKVGWDGESKTIFMLTVDYTNKNFCFWVVKFMK